MGYLTEHHSQFGPLGWPEQWLRVRRWHERVAPILADPPRPRPPTEADAADDVFALFMRLIVLDDGDERDMATVADQFIEAWQRFIAGLTRPREPA